VTLRNGWDISKDARKMGLWKTGTTNRVIWCGAIRAFTEEGEHQAIIMIWENTE